MCDIIHSITVWVTPVSSLRSVSIPFRQVSEYLSRGVPFGMSHQYYSMLNPVWAFLAFRRLVLYFYCYRLEILFQVTDVYLPLMWTCIWTSSKKTETCVALLLCKTHCLVVCSETTTPVAFFKVSEIFFGFWVWEEFKILYEPLNLWLIFTWTWQQAFAKLYSPVEAV